jgi:hypothetical protein
MPVFHSLERLSLHVKLAEITRKWGARHRRVTFKESNEVVFGVGRTVAVGGGVVSEFDAALAGAGQQARC